MFNRSESTRSERHVGIAERGEGKSDGAHKACNCEHCQEQADSHIRRIWELEEQNSNLRLVEDSVRRNTALFQALLTNSREGIVLTGPDRRIIRLVRSMIGRSPVEAAGEKIEVVVHPDDRQIAIDAYERALAEGNTQAFEVRLRQKDDSYLWVTGTVANLLDDPNVQAVVCNYSDISAWKYGQMMHAEFEAMAQNVRYAIFSEDPEGNVVTWNGGAERMFGFTQQEIVGVRAARGLVPQDLRDEESGALGQLLKTGKPVHLQTERLRKDGQRLRLLVDLSPVFDAYGRVSGVLQISTPV